MPQLLLDPDSTPQADKVWTPSEPIPPRVREFGFAPDTGEWKEGDLLLFSARNPGFISRGIIAAQSNGYSQEDARWHHAAVFIGGSRICEATVRSGVHVNSVYKYVPTHRIRVRRCVAPAAADWGHQIVIAALTRIGQRYSLGVLASIGLHALKGFWRIHHCACRPKMQICSKLYADAFSTATNRVLHNAGGLVPKPADLSMTAGLEDVPPTWVRIEGATATVAVDEAGEAPA